MYKDIARNIESFVMEIPETVIPKPTKTDIEVGYIVRYFCQKANDHNSTIFEIDNGGYSKFSKNPLWKTVQLRWRIKGPVSPTYKNEQLDDRGVRGSNTAAIALAGKEMPNLKYYLINPLQLYSL